jgi:hypothetical protein
VINYILEQMAESHEVVFVFAGPAHKTQALFEADARFETFVPYRVALDDFGEVELMDLLEELLFARFGGRMKIDGNDGVRGLTGRCAVRRVARGRKTYGFRNRLAVETLFADIVRRQADRLCAARRRGETPDDFLLVQKDILGPQPTDVRAQSASYKKLMGMIGLEEIKASVENLFGIAQDNYQRELLEKKPHVRTRARGLRFMLSMYPRPST